MVIVLSWVITLLNGFSYYIFGSLSTLVDHVNFFIIYILTVLPWWLFNPLYKFNKVIVYYFYIKNNKELFDWTSWVDVTVYVFTLELVLTVTQQSYEPNVFSPFSLSSLPHFKLIQVIISDTKKTDT